MRMESPSRTIVWSATRLSSVVTVVGTLLGWLGSGGMDGYCSCCQKIRSGRRLRRDTTTTTTTHPASASRLPPPRRLGFPVIFSSVLTFQTGDRGQE